MEGFIVTKGYSFKRIGDSESPGKRFSETAIRSHNLKVDVHYVYQLGWNRVSTALVPRLDLESEDESFYYFYYKGANKDEYEHGTNCFTCQA